MIRELRIRALGVIDEAVVPFSPGLTVLSGETGAGKTMVLTGLGLLMGDKADAAMVRTGAERADIDGEWGLAAGETEEVRALLEDSGARVELEAGDTVLLLGRTVAAEGRSRAFAGGRSVPASTLTDLTDHLIAVHGQSDQLLLRDARRQRDLLDRFAGAGHAARLAAFREVFEEWRQARRQLDELTIHRHEREREATLLRHGIDEIAAVAPESGEDEALKAQATVLAHATDLVAEAGGAHDLIAGGDGTAEPDNVASLLSRARVGRRAAAGHEPRADRRAPRRGDPRRRRAREGAGRLRPKRRGRPPDAVGGGGASAGAVGAQAQVRARTRRRPRVVGGSRAHGR
jgi:DNA repair protein RecN (Recombination protein N)